MATPVRRVAFTMSVKLYNIFLLYLPTSKEEHRAPRARKNEYMVIVSVKMNSRLIKNCEAVLARFAMLV